MSSKATILCSLFFILELSSLNGELQMQYPWHVDVFVKNEDNSFIACGGTLIKDTWVLTAAHCIQRASSIVILIGLTEQDHREYVTRADHFFVHQNYDIESNKNDFGLVHLHEPLPAKEKIHPVPLPTPEILKADLVGLTGFVSGFGKYSLDSDHYSPKLLWLNVVIVDQKECQQRVDPINESNLCAVSVQSDQKICSVDDGGSLIAKVGELMYVFGITLTNTSGCIGSPVSFENVGDQIGWIVETIKKEDH